MHTTATHSRHPPPRSHPRPRGWAGTGERGSGTIQLVVLMPLLFTLLFAGVQGAMYYHARTVAIAAAQEGARAAAAQTGTTGHGHAAAIAFLQAAGGEDVLKGATVQVTRTATTATVRVAGSILSVVPGWTPTVTSQVAVPVERLT
ncbi:pilus assembly protein [Nostocoides sp. F2B08]|uniref:TadE family protein n=1 Tax=Nostocoides sp. F2B08 TaxID=2653936 RepID=UPI001262B97A|nr:TadE family protein [Tetrasphaera sp. F2B08]KAB7740344.1 pilus assembly protein [Tetrasphaera sp. F2B08]